MGTRHAAHRGVDPRNVASRGEPVVGGHAVALSFHQDALDALDRAARDPVNHRYPDRAAQGPLGRIHLGQKGRRRLVTQSASRRPVDVHAVAARVAELFELHEPAHDRNVASRDDRDRAALGEAGQPIACAGGQRRLLGTVDDRGQGAVVIEEHAGAPASQPRQPTLGLLWVEGRRQRERRRCGRRDHRPAACSASRSTRRRLPPHSFAISSSP